MECPDIVIEEDYLSKPSPAKKANLSTGNNTDLQTKKTRASTGGGHTGGGGPGGGGADGGKEGMNKGSESGGAVTNGIEMESDEEESDDLFPPVPPPQVATSLLLTNLELRPRASPVGPPAALQLQTQTNTNK